MGTEIPNHGQSSVFGRSHLPRDLSDQFLTGNPVDQLREIDFSASILPGERLSQPWPDIRPRGEWSLARNRHRGGGPSPVAAFFCGGILPLPIVFVFVFLSLFSIVSPDVLRRQPECKIRDLVWIAGRFRKQNFARGIGQWKVEFWHEFASLAVGSLFGQAELCGDPLHHTRIPIHHPPQQVGTAYQGTV